MAGHPAVGAHEFDQMSAVLRVDEEIGGRQTEGAARRKAEELADGRVGEQNHAVGDARDSRADGRGAERLEQRIVRGYGGLRRSRLRRSFALRRFYACLRGGLFLSRLTPLGHEPLTYICMDIPPYGSGGRSGW